jgi:hypothetical protein
MERIKPKSEDDPPGEDVAKDMDLEAQDANNMQIVDPATAYDSAATKSSNVKITTNDEKVVIVDITANASAGGSLKKRGTSNNDRPIDVMDLNKSTKRTNNEKEIEVVDLGNGSSSAKRKITSNNDRPIDASDLTKIKKSNNERAPVDVADVRNSRNPTSNNEVPVDPNGLGTSGTKSLRGRRTSSNNERVIDVSELESKEPEPTPAELEATRKRAASLERRLEEMSRTHTTLAETARKLQDEIADLSSKNNDMLLDDR